MSAFSFVETQINTHPGETVQVCVQRDASLTTETIHLSLENADGQVIDGVAPSLVFVAGATEACFDFFVPVDFPVGQYFLLIKEQEGAVLEVNVEGEKSSKAKSSCGVVPQLGNVNPWEAIATDRFGNYYSYEQVHIPEQNTAAVAISSGGSIDCGCDEFPEYDTGIFNVIFEDCTLDRANGFAEQGQEGSDRRRVVCAAFDYLNNLITPNASICNPDEKRVVNIQIQPSFAMENYAIDSNLPPFNDNVLGYASPYYPEGFSYFDVGIRHSAPWIIINSGEYPLGYDENSIHAYMRINFESPLEWHTDLNTLPPGLNSEESNEMYDLYTVVLHEFTHAIGFTSAFNSSGTVIGSRMGRGTYNSFDQFLQVDYLNGTILDLIENGAENGDFTNGFPLTAEWFFNDLIDGLPVNDIDDPNDLHNSCSEDGPNVVFAGTAVNYPIYTGSVFSRGSSFSHLDGECRSPSDNIIPYVMHYSLSPNQARRVFLDEEIDILGRIGYNIGNDNCAVGTVIDGFDNCTKIYELVLCPPDAQSIVISLEDLLLNDPNAIEVAYIQPVRLYSEGTGQLNVEETEYVFTTSHVGVSYLRYATLGCDGELSNTSLIKINVKLSDSPDCLFYCPDLISCEDFMIIYPNDEFCYEYQDNCDLISGLNSCNLICNSDLCGTYSSSSEHQIFEETNGELFRIGTFEAGFFNKTNIPGWYAIEGTARYGNNIINENPFLNFDIIFATRDNIVMTFVPLQAEVDYLFSFYTESGYHPDFDDTSDNLLRIELLQGENVIPSPSQFGESFYDGPIEMIFEKMISQVENRDGGCFNIEQNNWQNFTAFSIIDVYMPEQNRSFSFFDFEVTEDNFSAGINLTSSLCGEIKTLGGIEFCMLSNIEIQYQWFRLNENNEIEGEAIYVYNTLNERSFVVENGIIVDVATAFDIAPGQTTTYRLVRTIIDRGGMPDDFAFCRTEDEITITVLEGFPDPSFTFEETDDCGVYQFFSDPSTVGMDHEWFVDENPIAFSELENPIQGFTNGNHSITHRVTGRCGIDEVSIPLPNINCDVCPTPVFTLTPQISPCGEVVFDISPLQAGDTYTIDYNNDGVEVGTDLSHTYTEGNHTASVTLTNDCGESATVTTAFNITFPPLPSATITIDDSDQCGLICFALADLVPPNATAEWHIEDTSAGGADYTDTQICHQFSADGTYAYKVTLTEPECGQMTTIEGEVTVTITVENPIGFTFTEDCEGGKVIITPDDLSRPFTWTLMTNPSQTQETLAGESAIFEHPENEGTYVLVYSYTGQCEEEIFNVEIEIGNCILFSCACEGDNSININAGAGTSLMDFSELTDLIDPSLGGENSFGTANKCIAIRGKLIVDSDAQFFGGHFIMQPGSEIVITGGAAVQFRGNQPDAAQGLMEGCEQLWKGIYVEEGDLLIGDYRIEDAEHAIYAENNTKIGIVRCEFKKNFIGLYHSGNGFRLSQFNGNSFDGNTTLLPPFDEMLANPIVIESRSYAGVYLSFSGGNPYPTDISSNIFSNLPLGIYADGHFDIAMTNNQFHDIRLYPTVSYPIKGYGLYLDAFKTSSLNLKEGIYDNCVYGIHIKKADTEIFNTQITGGRIGVEVVNVSAEIGIHDNTINVPAFATAISLLHNDGADDILVKDNTITVSSSPNAQNRGAGYGIAIRESTHRLPSKNVRILSNIIEMNTGFINEDFNSAGIFLNAANNVRVSNFNKISCATSDDVGLLINGSYNCEISNNEVTGIGQNGIGLKVQDTYRAVYSCNAFATLKTGAEFVAGNAFGSYLAQNTFSGPMNNGLVYQNGLTINEQEHTLNKWLGGYSGFAALNESSNPDIVFQQLYIVHTMLSPYWPPSIFPSNTGLEPWFRVEETDEELLPPCNELGIVSPNCKPTKLDTKIASGLGLTGDYIVSRKWAVERAAYGKLQCMDIPGLDLPINEKDELISFKNAAENGQIGAYKRVSDDLTAIHNHETLLHDDWIIAWESKRNLLKDWFELHQRLDENSSTTEWNTYATLLEDITEANTELDVLWQEKQVTIDAKIDAANGINDALVPDILPQDNEKAINDILLRRILSGKTNFEDLEMKLLKEIANQCPLEGGVSVYIARSLYALIDVDEVFEIDCSGIQGMRNSSGQSDVSESVMLDELNKQEMVSTTELTIYPNPVDGQLFVHYNSTNNCYIQLLNSFGKVLLSKQIEAGNHKFNVNTAGFSSGLYLMKLDDGEGKVDVRKIIITH